MAKTPEEIIQVEEYCDILWTWLKLVEERVVLDDEQVDHNLLKVAEAAPAIRLAVSKSSYLGRRLYGGEAHRPEICPVHQGRWSGLAHPNNPPACGCDLTGWLHDE